MRNSVHTLTAWELVIILLATAILVLSVGKGDEPTTCTLHRPCEVQP